MAKVMLRQSMGETFFYIAKKDMEESIQEIEFDSDEKWGGNIILTNGENWWIKPKVKQFPQETIAKKVN